MGHVTKEVVDEILEERITELEKILKEISRQKSRLPEGRLEAVYGKRKRYYFVQNEYDGEGKLIVKRKSIKKDEMHFAHKLAQRDYDLVLKNCVLAEIKLMKELQKCDGMEKAFLTLPIARKQIVRSRWIGDEEYAKAWASEEYRGLGFDDFDETDFYTAKGERVRSKSEVMIADLLDMKHIPYKYEYPLKIGNGYKYPDFIVLNKKTREEFVWEHLGMMDNPEYVERNVKKIKQYNEVGYLLGKNLILTMESKLCPLSTMVVRKIIDEMLV